ncbi:MAG: hypothetical protein WA001_04700 [Patescibacteria group bacterium]
MGILDPSILSHERLLAAIHEWEPFPRIQSYLAFHALNLPTLDGFVVFAWDNRTERNLHNVLKRYGWDAAVLRSDMSTNAHTKPRGGFLFQAEELVRETKRVLDEGRIPFLLAPANRWRNRLNGTILFSPGAPLLEWETIGEGFDMSDLQRGDNIPHEHFQTSRSAGVHERTNYRRIPREEYAKSVQWRIEKAGSLAPQELHPNLMTRGRVFLAQQGSRLALLPDITPIPLKTVRQVAEYIHDLPARLRQVGITIAEPFTISFSIVETDALVFWDVFSAKNYLR